MIGYISQSDLAELKAAGVTGCLFSVSETPQYLGALTAVCFLSGDHEIAHQTQLAGEFGVPNVAFYRRPFGLASSRAYRRSTVFDALLEVPAEDLVGHQFRIVP